MQIMPTSGGLPIGPVRPTSAPAAPVAPTAPTPPAQVPTTTIDGDVPSSKPGRQDPAQLEKAVRGVLSADGNARLAVDPTTNAATFLSGDFGVVTKPGVGGSGPDRLARTFLHQHGGVFGLVDPVSELKLVSVAKDELGFKHVKFQQLHHGLPVFGQQLVVHANGDKVTSVGGRITPNIVDAEATLQSADAARSAISSVPRSVAGIAQVKAVGKQQLGWFTAADGAPHLAYEVVVGAAEDQRWQMYVDARSGEVLDRWSLVHSAMNRETVDSATGKVRKEGQGPSADKVLDAAHDNAGSVYAFYNEMFGRDSLDDKGMKLKSIVHYGQKYNNAFWNGSQMTYGDGDGVRFIPFALALDVVGHEMTHGVTERTAALRYQRQSGALNESWSDVFGNIIEKWADVKAGKPERDPKWLIGEEIFTPGTEGDALRSMSEPGHGYDKDPQPGHMKDYKDTSSDNGGVHINSGIPNKAAYEVAKVLGVDTLAKIWFRTLTQYLTPSSQFSDAANFAVQSAVDLYGAGSKEATTVAAAWQSVGLAPTTKPVVVG